MQKQHKIIICTLLFIVAIASAVAAQSGSAASTPDNKAVSSDSYFSEGNKPVPEYDFGAETQSTKSDPMWLTVIKLLFSLVLVLAIAFGCLLALKKFSIMKGSPFGGGSRIRVMESASLGANKMLHMVKIGDKRLLVASTPSQVNLICEIEGELEDIVEAMPSEAGAPQGMSLDFRKQLATLMGRPPEVEKAEENIAGMLRNSSTHFQGKAGEVGSLKKKIADLGKN